MTKMEMLNYLIESGNVKESDRNYLMRGLKERIERIYNDCYQRNLVHGTPRENGRGW